MSDRDELLSMSKSELVDEIEDLRARLAAATGLADRLDPAELKALQDWCEDVPEECNDNISYCKEDLACAIGPEAVEDAQTMINHYTALRSAARKLSEVL